MEMIRDRLVQFDSPSMSKLRKEYLHLRVFVRASYSPKLVGLVVFSAYATCFYLPWVLWSFYEWWGLLFTLITTWPILALSQVATRRLKPTKSFSIHSDALNDVALLARHVVQEMDEAFDTFYSYQTKERKMLHGFTSPIGRS
jgi:hypothetical protein